MRSETRQEGTRSATQADACSLRIDLALRAVDIRRQVVAFAHENPGLPFHLGGSLSCAEILAVLFGSIMHTGVDGTPWEERDRLVLSKGHASLSLWPALRQAGLLSDEDLDRGVLGPGAIIGKQPRRDVTRGIELSGGSLGMGLGYAAGLAVAARRKGTPSRVFCLMGDGECGEGSVWEAAAFVGHNRLSSLTVIIDENGLQLDGPVSEVLDSGPLSDKFSSFGFEVRHADGHDAQSLEEALSLPSDRPLAVFAKTVKGKGISFAENNVAWHDYHMSEDEYRRAVAELDAAREEVLGRDAR